MKSPFALALAVAWSLSIAAPLSAAADELSFNRDIRPILSQNCFACHGFDAKQRQADLRLDVAEQALAVRDGKTAIKPGDLANSEMWKRINSTDPDEVMPPADSKKTLSAEQKETLRRWIEGGAAYQKHWAFEPPVKAAEPPVCDAQWPRNAVDRFILARLEAEGLKPLAEADKETLVRRLAFALTGLPPTVAEVDRYLADPSPRAYEELVDRYLASPAFGEEMARHWLDLARYADTHGLHLDNERQMWAYRDWVVKALNDNLPFDQFTVWQLAGDLLPGATAEQLTATGFNRCNVTTSEGGAINDEFVYRYAVDRASTTMQTWLGLTGGCAVCHDHKYDPLSTKEFYSFYAFFNSAADPGMDKNINDTEPFYQLPHAGQQAALEAARQQEAEAKGRLEQTAATTEYADPAETPPAAELAPAVEVVFDDFFPLGASVRNTSRNASAWLDRPKFGAPSGRRVLRQANSHFHEDAVQIELQRIVVPIAATFETWLYLDPHNTPGAVAVVIGASSGTRRAWWGEANSPDGLRGAAANERLGRLPPPGAWTKLTFSAEALQLKPGDTINSITLQEAGGVACWDAFAVTGASALAIDPVASFKAWRKAVAGKSPGDVPAELQAVLKAGPDKQDGPDKQADPQLQDKLRHFYLAYVAHPESDDLAARRHEWQSARAARLAAEDAIAGTMIFRDLAAARDSFVMVRGQYDKPGEKVEPGVPAVFPPLGKAQADARANRLDLARWLVSAEQPLTARVQANRLWQQFFGIGLVKTSYDFGTQGELPSHPELLDWLAIQFRESGWNVKDFVRLLVTSAAFRQQSFSSPELRKRDPENRLYARGPRFRLDAEQVRDNVLFVSGLINLTMGGRGVNAYQPPNIWEPVGYSDSNTRYYLQDHGPALYRRSLYAFLKRTAPPPFMSNFDGPNREQFCTRRERGNTPLQALQLMNDVQHFEAARALAERAIGEGGSTPVDRVAFLYRTVLSRRPEAEESQLVCQAFDVQLKLFQAEPEAAGRAIRVGESTPKKLAPDVETAAWTLVANLILNLDETVNRN